MSDSAPVSVRASPGAETWAGLALDRFAKTTPEQRAARQELGLPTDRPVIMTGHQVGFWHPGILAKYIAADRVAKATGGTAAAVVVDHDVVDPLRLEAVRLRADGGVERAVVSLRARGGKATLPRLEPSIGSDELERWRGERGLIETDRVAIEAIASALAQHAESESLGAQVASANANLLKEWASVEQFTAQRLVRSDGWKAFFERAVEEADACVGAYNLAVERHPEAGMPRLFAMAREYRWELPFWLLDRDHGRRSLYEEMVEQDGFDPDLLATKALSLTASVRRGLCDLFIHGTGGAIYDRATDVWMREWLGEELAPSVSITADVHREIPIEAMRDATEDDLAQALWLVHSAMHNPELVGDEEAAREKRALVERIHRESRGSAQRLDLYRAMHQKLETVRAKHAADLDELERRAITVERGLVVRRLEAKRDWPSVLYPRERLDRLVEAIEGLLSPVSL